jgi:rhodanese-related sulfurtransferase
VDRAILDIRQAEEYREGHVPGAINIELGALAEHVDAVPNEPITLMCGHGERAMTGASLLERAGVDELTVLHAGPNDWSRSMGEALARAR